MSVPRAATPRRARTPSGRARSASRTPSLLSALMLLPVPVLAVFAAWPIYETTQLWLVAGLASLFAFGVVWLGATLRWGAMTIAVLAVTFVLIVVPLGVPGALGEGPLGFLRGLGDGLAGIALGWKQLLTLTLPLGSYQAVLVPFVFVVFVAVAGGAALMIHGGRWAPTAGFAFVAPVLFGTVFGSSAVSKPLEIGAVAVAAPRELALWLAAFAAAVAWVAWSSGRERRAALRRGRLADSGLGADAADGADLPNRQEAGHRATRFAGRNAVRRNTIVRGAIAAATVAVALVGALVLAPLANQGPRTVPRDAVDPELVVRDRVSPLASYRSWKRDDALTAPMFTVTSEADALPGRLRLAVLSGFDGVDFTVGDQAAVGRFARFPSGGDVPAPIDVTVQISAGYSDVWVPIATPLASPPAFTGPRAGALADSFYLNRDTGSAVAVPTPAGLREGDGFTATMSGTGDAQLDATPASDSPLIDLESVPQLARWLTLQELPASGEGVTRAIERLRERGYLSHSLTDSAGESAWLLALAPDHAIRFVSTPGGHSAGRLEQLFIQLTEQQLAAGDDASQAMLVAGIGDDEQFAAAAALVARAMGFDSRVVVGVRLGGSDAGVPGTPACASSCSGEHLAAWVEVAGADGVWAPLDVSPQVDVPPTMLQKGEQLPEFPTQPEDRDASESDPPVGMTNQENGEVGDTEPNNLSALLPVLRFAGLLLLGLALIAAVVLFIPLVKRVRSRKRRAHTVPELRALAAWDELLDAFRDGGATPPAAGRSEVMRSLKVEGGDWIAWTVDQAVYAREGITAETADTLWEIVDARVAKQWDDRSVWKRLRARFSFGSFVRPSNAHVRDALRRRERKGDPQ